MLATIFVHCSLGLIPLLQPPQPTRDCQSEVLTRQAIEERALVEFDAKLRAYVMLHRRLARSRPPERLFDDEGAFFGDELRLVIVAGRPGTTQGEFFGPSVGDVFRARIDRARLRGAAGIAALLHEPLPGEQDPAVNYPFPLVVRPVQWPALANELPRLPTEIAYAFWGRNLVLVDVAANLVIDVLPEALPEGARPGVVYQ